MPSLPRWLCCLPPLLISSPSSLSSVHFAPLLAGQFSPPRLHFSTSPPSVIWSLQQPGPGVYFSKLRRVPPLAGKQLRLCSRAANEPSRSFHRAWSWPIPGPTRCCFNKKEALVGAFSGHCKTSRRLVDSSTAESALCFV